MPQLKYLPTAAVLSIAVAFAGQSVLAAAAAASPAASCSGSTSASSFTVLHNDRSGGVILPAGQYRISSPNLTCKTAGAYFTTFLAKYNGPIPGWTGQQFAVGYGKYSKKNSKLNFTVKLTKRKQLGVGLTASCPGSSFTVLHNDRSGGVILPAGQYRVSSPNLACKTAGAYFTTFLAKYNGPIPGWTARRFAVGYGKYSKKNSKLNFTVKLTKRKLQGIGLTG